MRRRRPSQGLERVARTLRSEHTGTWGGRLPTMPKDTGGRGGPRQEIEPSQSGVRVHKIAVQTTAEQDVADSGLVEWGLVEGFPRSQVGFSSVSVPTTQLKTDISGPAVISVEAGKWSEYRNGEDEEIVITTAGGDETVVPLQSYGIISSSFFGVTPAVDLNIGDSVALRPNFSGSAQTLSNCRMQIEQIEYRATSGQGSLVLLETFFVDTRVACSGIGGFTDSSMTLQSGVGYRLVVDGSNTVWEDDGKTGTFGSPIDLIYPSPSGGAQTLAAFDAGYAYSSAETDASFPHHSASFRVSVDGGSSYFHPTHASDYPSTPQEGGDYPFAVTGEGSPLRYQLADTPCTDNNGRYRIRIYGIA